MNLIFTRCCTLVEYIPNQKLWKIFVRSILDKSKSKDQSFSEILIKVHIEIHNSHFSILSLYKNVCINVKMAVSWIISVHWEKWSNILKIWKQLKNSYYKTRCNLEFYIDRRKIKMIGVSHDNSLCGLETNKIC